MPILDPSLQYFLFDNDSKQKNPKNGYAFFLKYLQIASKNIFQNLETIEASKRFKKDLQESIHFVNDELGCNFPNDNHYFENQHVNDYYKYLYDNINIPNKLQESKKYIGSYITCNNFFNTKLYQPCLIYHKYHSWYLSDTPIAILCINSEKFTEINPKIYQLIKLEIDLMNASGFTLVLCYKGLSNTSSFLYELIKDDQFSELHINIFDANFLKEFLIFIKNRFLDCSIFLKGYLYLYSNYYDEYSETWFLMKLFRKIPFVKIISFSMDPKEALIQCIFVPTKPFQHCKTGFDQTNLRIYLCYVPIFEEEDFTGFKKKPSFLSDLCIGYIQKVDFLYLRKKYIIIYFSNNKLNSYKRYLVCFDDIHLLRPDLFVKDTLALAQMNQSLHNSIDLVREKIDQKLNESEKLVKSYISNIGLKDFMLVIRRVAYAYTYFMQQTNPNFKIRRTQIYVVIEACQMFFNKSQNENKKGCIYQIKTGEGKSCIITLIAAVLAIKKMPVHIVSSNINLSNRDYCKSYEFFKLLKLETAVLLHKNELPNSEDDNQKYSNKFYEEETFNNSSRMNFSVCGLGNNNNETHRADIVFSTFVNLECFYLYLIENSPALVDKCICKCRLLIDEADSILIDEITNGTIVSRKLNSNAKEVLSLVYKLNDEGKTAKETFDILKKHKICKDIILEDVEQMYEEIELINTPEFTDGKKYKVEEIQIKNKKKIINSIKKAVYKIKTFPEQLAGKADEYINQFIDKAFVWGKKAVKKKSEQIKDKIEEEEEEEKNEKLEFDETKEEEEENELITDKFVVFRKIIPNDFENKGTLERNKEFSGFIPQFIALKESEKFDNIIFKGISISFLYVSHPIFARLYSKICGFTGTVGKHDDKEIFSKQYKLSTKKVPRFKPNLRVDFPVSVYKNIESRNNAISEEILTIHEKGNPILVIFKDFREIEEVKKVLSTTCRSKKVNYDELIINEFKDDKIKPDEIAGKKGVISLGTNICGRGTDIICSSSFPLHVIVSYYTHNIRVMEQAFGRTARIGQVGSCHCICTHFDISSKTPLKPEKIKSVLNEFEIKSELQSDFIDFYKKTRPWIFEFVINKLSYNGSKAMEKLRKLRDSKINVNRIVAFKFKYPVIMSYDTFLEIQSQKIFSLFNCPNCKYSWRIFQRYVREMILHSWTLMITRFDQKNLLKKKDDNKNLSYEKELKLEIKKLHKSIEKYLPLNLPDNEIDMVSTFFHICNLIRDKYTSFMVNNFELSHLYKVIGKPENPIFFQLGFKPFLLLNKSGVRITYENSNGANFIKDPELSYEKRMPNNRISLLSITERIDDVFNLIFQKINEILSEKFFLKFYLRRTLAGCEFGICLDFHYARSKKLNDPFLLIDKDPFLLCTIYIWSIVPLLAGILIIVVIYLIGVANEMAKNSSGIPVTSLKQFGKYTIEKAKKILSEIVPSVGEKLFEKGFYILDKILNDLIKDLENQNDDFVLIIKTINIDLLNGGGDFNDSLFDNFIKIPESSSEIVNGLANGPLILKLSLKLLLILAAFLRRFTLNRKRIESSKQDEEKDADSLMKKSLSESKKYDSSFDNKKSSQEELDKIIEKNEKNKKKKDKKKKKEKIEENDKIDKILEKDIQKYIETGIFNLLYTDLKDYKIDFTNILPYKKNLPNFCITKTSQKICVKVYSEITSDYCKWIELFSKQKHHSIAPFVGFVLNTNESFLLFDSKINDYHYSYLDFKNKIDSFDLSMFAYGIACGMEFLHKNKIICPFLSPSNIIIYNKFCPLIIPLRSSYIKFDEKSESENNKKKFFEMLNLNNVYHELLAPEICNDPLNCDFDSLYKANVYSFGLILYLISENNPSIKEIKKNGKIRKTSNVNGVIIDIINNAIDDHNKRYTFSQISDELEKFFDSEIEKDEQMEPIYKWAKMAKYLDFYNLMKNSRK